jgi:dihydrofolate synthase/folylpolyglutamate synthase
VDRNSLAAAAAEIRAAIERLRASGGLAVQPTFFEATTAVAFELFRRGRIDVGVLEVGLGGRFDATNVVEASLGAITTIDLDHQQYLGRTLSDIAFEKAGIIRPGMRVVTGETKPEAVTVIDRVARERGARLVRTADDVRMQVEMEPDGISRVRIDTPRRAYAPMRLALRGRHQAANAAVAVRLLELAEEGGMPIDARAIARGLERTWWPGRLELLPYAGGHVLLDAAHNPAGARTLAAYLAEAFPGRHAVVFGVLRDKDVRAMLSALAPCARLIVATDPPTPRARAAVELGASLGAEATGAPIAVEPLPADALRRARASAPLVCVTGSIFLVGAVRELIDPGGTLRPAHGILR